MSNVCLIDKNCVPCEGGVPPLTKDEIATFMKELPGGWTVVDDHHLTRHLTFPDFVTALAFVNAAAAVAESEGHHPDLLLRWGKVDVTLYTHAIDGLAENDFIVAAKLEALPR